MKVIFSDINLPNSGIAFFLVKDMSDQIISDLDSITANLISKSAQINHFECKDGDLLEILFPNNLGLEKLILLALPKSRICNNKAKKIGKQLISYMFAKSHTDAYVFIEESADLVALGASIANYRFEEFKKIKKPEIKSITIKTKNFDVAEKEYMRLSYVSSGTSLACDLINLPANHLTPKEFVRHAEELRKYNVDVEILGTEELKKMNMNAMLAVGQGSINESFLVIAKWKGTGSRDNPVVFVGKGVTFDSGGLSLKPSSAMETMKYDMAGAAIIVGLMASIAKAQLKLPFDVIIAAGLVENMPSGSAMRPGDIVRSMSGKTIEILNTDAEGRLVLADVLYYVKKTFSPKIVVDLATLTGAMVSALGTEYAGLFANDDFVAEKLLLASKKSGEKLWRMPLDDEFAKLVESSIADLRNTSTQPGAAGSITAAQFLKNFIDDVPWAHIDIAGMIETKKGKIENHAYGIHLLYEFLCLLS